MKEVGERSSKRTSVSQVFKNVDFEGRSFDFYLPDGTRYQKSMSGGCIFICMTVLFILYASVLFQVLVERTDYNILERRYENELLETNFSFGRENGFAVAAAFAELPVQPEPIEDPEIGYLEFALRSWDNANSSGYHKPLKSRPCTEEDFKIKEGSDRSDYGFYKIKDQSLFPLIEVSMLKCIDE